MIRRPSARRGAKAARVVAIKQIYADHYFEGALELFGAFDAPATPRGPAIYLISVRRYRFDALPSGGFLNLRGRVRGRLADAVRADLERERQDAGEVTEGRDR